MTPYVVLIWERGAPFSTEYVVNGHTPTMPHPYNAYMDKSLNDHLDPFHTEVLENCL